MAANTTSDPGATAHATVASDTGTSVCSTTSTDVTVTTDASTTDRPDTCTTSATNASTARSVQASTTTHAGTTADTTADTTTDTTANTTVTASTKGLSTKTPRESWVLRRVHTRERGDDDSEKSELAGRDHCGGIDGLSCGERVGGLFVLLLEVAAVVACFWR
jgi:hypothetical protein